MQYASAELSAATRRTPQLTNQDFDVLLLVEKFFIMEKSLKENIKMIIFFSGLLKILMDMFMKDNLKIIKKMEKEC